MGRKKQPRITSRFIFFPFFPPELGFKSKRHRIPLDDPRKTEASSDRINALTKYLDFPIVFIRATSLFIHFFFF